MGIDYAITLSHPGPNGRRVFMMVGQEWGYDIEWLLEDTANDKKKLFCID